MRGQSLLDRESHHAQRRECHVGRRRIDLSAHLREPDGVQRLRIAVIGMA